MGPPRWTGVDRGRGVASGPASALAVGAGARPSAGIARTCRGLGRSRASPSVGVGRPAWPWRAAMPTGCVAAATGTAGRPAARRGRRCRPPRRGAGPRRAPAPRASGRPPARPAGSRAAGRARERSRGWLTWLMMGETIAPERPTSRRPIPAPRALMPDDRTAATLLREVGLMADGPVTVGQARAARRARRVRHRARRTAAEPAARPRRSSASGSSASPSSARRRAAGVEGPPGRLASVLAPLAADRARRLARRARVAGPRRRRWRRPSRATASPRVRVLAALPPAPCRTSASGGRRPTRPRSTRTRCSRRSRPASRRRSRPALPDPAIVLPWAVLRSPSGIRKPTGITNPLLPEVKAPEPVPVTRIVELPPADADGARDEAKRGRRPAPGRGTGRIASAAAFAAQGSPRKVHEPVYPLARGPRPARGGARRARRPAAGRHQAHRDRTGARRPQGERRVPRRARGAGVPGGADQVARGEAQDRGRRRADGARRGRGAGRTGAGRWSTARRPTMQVVSVRRGQLARGPDLELVAGGRRADGPQGGRRR